MNAIVIYYSKSGTTRDLAEKISRDLSCEVICIQPKKEYGSYLSAVVRVAKEKLTQNRPGYLTPVPDLTSYDTVLFGYPIWYSEPPQFAVDFMKQCNLDGKTIIPFATAGGNTVDVTLKTVKDICSTARVTHPFTWAMKQKDDYTKWIQTIREACFSDCE